MFLPLALIIKWVSAVEHITEVLTAGIEINCDVFSAKDHIPGMCSQMKAL